MNPINKESKPPSAQTIRLLVEIPKHPFVLLVLGAIITSLLIPYLNSKVTRSQLLQEARLKKATEIGDRNMEFSSKFNALKTMLESFHRRSVRLRLPPSEFKETHSRFVDDFYKRYLELDEKAWWWYPAVEREASVLHLVSETEQQTLSTDCKAYGDNLNESFNILRPLWQAMTSNDYNPSDKNSAEKVEKIIKEANDQLPKLFQARNDLMERIARHFSAPQ
jgi:hypothetical protein